MPSPDNFRTGDACARSRKTRLTPHPGPRSTCLTTSSIHGSIQPFALPLPRFYGFHPLSPKKRDYKLLNLTAFSVHSPFLRALGVPPSLVLYQFISQTQILNLQQERRRFFSPSTVNRSQLPALSLFVYQIVFGSKDFLCINIALRGHSQHWLLTSRVACSLTPN